MMPKVEAKKAGPISKTQKPVTATKSTTAKGKRKNWLKVKFKRIKPAPKEKVHKKPTVTQKVSPPEDAQQFSANWKALQELLKASQQEKKPAVTPTSHNGALLKKEPKEKASKTISKSDIGPTETDTVKKVKHKPISKSVIPVDSQVTLTVPAVSETKQSAALKRKRDNAKSDSKQATKKNKKDVVEEKKKPTEADLWFDDVDPDDIEATVGAEAAEIMRKKQGIHKNTDTDSMLVKEKAFEGLTRAVAIDCEMVGVGPDGEESIVARVSLVNQFGKCIYDKYVKPTETVTDYRTAFSGIRPEDIKDGEDVRTVQKEVAEILQGRIVVGHAIHNDLKILLLDHPKKKIRDTQKYKPFKKSVKSGRPSLKLLCREILNVKVQQGEHSSVQDAQATMRLYTLMKKQWELEIKNSHKNKDSEKKSNRKPKFPQNRDKKRM